MMVHVKFGPRTYTVSVEEGMTGAAFQEHLQELTGVFARHQKLIFKGKVVDMNKTLSSQGITSGTKLMLLASAQGPTGRSESEALTKGQQAAKTQSQQKAAEAQARLSLAFASAKGRAPPPGTAALSAAATEGGGAGIWHVLGNLAQRRQNWARTGMVALRDLQLVDLPQDIFEGLQQLQQKQEPTQHPLVPTQQHEQLSQTQEPLLPPAQQLQQQQQEEGESKQQPRQQHQEAEEAPSVCSGRSSSANIRLVDCSHNLLQSLPPSVAALTRLVTLRLNHNRLGTAGFPWELLADACGGSLGVLEVDHNELTCLPGHHLSSFTALTRLTAAGNQISHIPDEVGRLRSLQELNLDRNNLQGLPSSLGSCSTLQGISAAENYITSIPGALAACSLLQALRLSKNMISQVPPELLSHSCPSLWMLDLAANPITADQLRSTQNYAIFDERRRAKANKQLEGGVLLDSSRAFKEGADSRGWEHWRAVQK